ncbi:phosphate signaling complex protein PhoU [Halobacterium bonnevillei]|uniref:Phosphate-specific transport system accessory protein PhoU n=1 Tax=Halobacterium bonnevillei TaxID=2692200 RepID=A0A6B0SQZ9_9EURY|nr:phosphate signaling complex protein PhoU [Halobacterium bonnevillei]MXR20019.1 phosphate signaling complex protein PhoU [Halobacterium bonnevillei]
MTRETYQDSLSALCSDVCAMGDLVLDRLEHSLTALDSGDDALAREVIDGDDDVNERYLELEGDCIDLLALQQPVAGDLRFVAASFKVITDLERIGDLATNFGRYALAARNDHLTGVDVDGIGDEVHALVADAMDAYARQDTEACYDIAARDDHVDALCQTASDRVLRDLIERAAGERAWGVEALLDDVCRLLLTIRDLERVADHAVNVAARTLYAADSNPELVY